MAARKNIPSRVSRAESDCSDLDGILGRFSDALAIVTTVHRSLVAQEKAGNEEVVLRIAITVLNTIYGELDAAARRCNA
jgi:hypothetical protein